MQGIGRQRSHMSSTTTPIKSMQFWRKFRYEISDGKKYYNYEHGPVQETSPKRNQSNHPRPAFLKVVKANLAFRLNLRTKTVLVFLSTWPPLESSSHVIRIGGCDEDPLLTSGLRLATSGFRPRAIFNRSSRCGDIEYVIDVDVADMDGVCDEASHEMILY